MTITGIPLDVNETLFSIGPVRDRFEGAGLERCDVDVWFARVLRDGFALAATESVETFPVIATHQLRTLLHARGLSASDQTVEHVLGAFQDVQPHPDVAEGLLAAREAALPAATLTNGTAEITRGFLDRAGLGGLVEVALEARRSGVWKAASAGVPMGRRKARSRAGTTAARHGPSLGRPRCDPGWAAGGRLNRDDEDYPDHFRGPHIQAASLAQVVAAATQTG